jgi:parallel beta-helix repeat protein
MTVRLVVRRLSTTVAVALLLGCTALIDVAHAAVVSCGDVITEDTTLEADVGPCPGNGIVIGADNITLDLGGHTILGTGSFNSSGIDVAVRSGVRVRNGTVTGFQIGVRLVQGLGGHTVERLSVVGNLCTGIGISGTRSILVRGNDVSDNGCVGVGISGTTNSTVEANRISDNASHGVSFTIGGLSSRATAGNVIRSNVIRGNGGDGVSVGTLAGSNSIIGNVIAGNAQNGVHIVVFSFDQCCTLVQGNRITGNGANGVLIDQNLPAALPADLRIRVLSNVATGNAIFDLADLNENCDNNTWAGNTYGTRNQPCIN